jgi:hypothetical protein
MIDLSTNQVSLRDPDDFTRFSLAVTGGGTSVLERVVEASGLGRLKDAEHVVVNQEALRALAGPAATEAWEEGLSGMVAYAAGKGWVEADGGIVAHIERGSEAG